MGDGQVADKHLRDARRALARGSVRWGAFLCTHSSWVQVQVRACTRGDQLVFLSHANVLSLPLPLSLKSVTISLGKELKKQEDACIISP